MVRGNVRPENAKRLDSRKQNSRSMFHHRVSHTGHFRRQGVRRSAWRRKLSLFQRNRRLCFRSDKRAVRRRRSQLLRLSRTVPRYSFRQRGKKKQVQISEGKTAGTHMKPRQHPIFTVRVKNRTVSFCQKTLWKGIIIWQRRNSYPFR